jgi:hypothetical protein
LKNIKERIQPAEVRAADAVNRELILLYLLIGREVLTRQAAGSSLGVSGDEWEFGQKPRLLEGVRGGLAGGINVATACCKIAVGA